MCKWYQLVINSTVLNGENSMLTTLLMHSKIFKQVMNIVSSALIFRYPLCINGFTLVDVRMSPTFFQIFLLNVQIFHDKLLPHYLASYFGVWKIVLDFLQFLLLAKVTLNFRAVYLFLQQIFSWKKCNLISQLRFIFRLRSVRHTCLSIYNCITFTIQSMVGRPLPKVTLV